MRAADLDGSTRALMAPACRDCVWWQSDLPVTPSETGGDVAGAARDPELRAAWEREVLTDAGLFGRILIDDDGAAVGWMHSAPARLLARVAALPGGRPEPATWVLTCAYFHDEAFLSGFQRLLHDLIAALRRRDIATIEAYALRPPDPDDRFRGYLREVNLFNAGVLEGNGFHRVAGAGAVGRYRLETETLLSVPRRSPASEKLAARPATIAT